MPIDPTIALQVKPVALNDPMEMFGKMQQLKHLDQSNQLLGLQQQQLGDTIANNRAVRAMFGDENNFETTPDGLRVLKQDQQQKLWQYDPAVGNTYSDNMQNMRTKAALMKKEQTAAALQQFQIDEKKHLAAVDSAVGLVHAFQDKLVKYGGDPIKPYANPMALQTAEAEVERELRPQARQELIAAGLLDPNSPETPFTYAAYSRIAAQKEKFSDLQKERLGQKLGNVPLQKGSNNHWWAFPPGAQPYDTGVGTQENFSQPVAIQATKDTPAGALSMGNEGTVKEIPYSLAKGAKGPTVDQSKSLAHFKVMLQADGELDALSVDSKDADGRVVKGVKRVPLLAGMRNNDADPGFFGGVKNAMVNGWMSDREQRYVQASDQFLTTLGYHFSGMQIPQTEFGKLWRTYIGMPSDSDAVLRQKQRARKNIIATAKEQGGIAEDATKEEREAGLARLLSQGALDDAEIEKVRRQERDGARGSPAGGGAREQLIYDPTKKMMVPAPKNTGSIGGSWDDAPAAAPAAAPAPTPAPAPAPAPAAAPAPTAAPPALIAAPAPTAAPAAAAPPVQFPPDQLPQLREGVQRKFMVNGEEQYWTLHNGQPTRVQH